MLQWLCTTTSVLDDRVLQWLCTSVLGDRVLQWLCTVTSVLGGRVLLWLCTSVLGDRVLQWLCTTTSVLGLMLAVEPVMNCPFGVTATRHSNEYLSGEVVGGFHSQFQEFYERRAFL